MPTALTGDKVLRLKNTTVAARVRSKHVPVTGGRTYRFLTEWQADSITGGNTFAFKVEWFSGKTTSLSTDTIISSEAAVVDTYEISAKVFTAPATARWCQMTLEKAAVAFNVFIDRVEMDDSILRSAFLAFYTANDVTAGAESTFLTFETDAEDYDFNNDYNLTTDVFTVPADGVYELHAQVFMSDSDGMTTLECRIRDTGNSLTLAEDNADTIPNRVVVNGLGAAAAATVKLTAGDTIEAQYRYTSVTGEPDGAPQVEGTIGHTEFRGRLVHLV